MSFQDVGTGPALVRVAEASTLATGTSVVLFTSSEWAYPASNTSSGSSADTSGYGTSTTSEIRRSTVALQSA